MRNKRLAFVFPGQGSQFPGMGKDFLEASPHMREDVEKAASALDIPILDLMLNGTQEELKDTRNAQPALFIFETAIHAELIRRGITPVIVAGHSLGEYCALVAAGVLDRADGLKMVDIRGQLMASAGSEQPGGMMAILGLTDEQVEEACRETGGQVSMANYNSPGQVVISGTLEDMERAATICKNMGARRTILLPVSGAFHSTLVQTASDEMEAEIERYPFRDPEVPIVTNVDGEVKTDAQSVKQKLLKQMVSGVQWTKTMATIEAFGVDALIEVGPGAVLAGLAKRTTPSIPCHTVGTWAQLESLTQSVVE